MRKVGAAALRVAIPALATWAVLPAPAAGAPTEPSEGRAAAWTQGAPPDLAVYVGSSAPSTWGARWARWPSSKEARWLKLAAGTVMLALGIVLLVQPAWLLG